MSGDKKRPNVAVVQWELPHYRQPLFAALAERFNERGWGFALALPREQIARAGAKREAWCVGLDTFSIATAGVRILDMTPIRRASVLVVVGAVSMVPTLVAERLRIGAPRRLVFWGHGRDFQRTQTGLVTRHLWPSVARWPDWWLGYTQWSHDALTALGYPASRITVVNNTVDLAALQAGVESLGDSDVEAFRREHDIGDGPVGLFLGRMYSRKRLDFLLNAATMVHAEMPSFRLILVGDGPEEAKARLAAVRHPWVSYLGRLEGRTRCLPLKVADLVLMPGLLGLVLLDSFAIGKPCVTTAVPFHSPEAAYLEPGLNCLVVQDSSNARAYAQAVIALLRDSERVAELKRGCLGSARRYTMASMVEHFVTGVIAASDAPRRGRRTASAKGQM